MEELEYRQLDIIIKGLSAVTSLIIPILVVYFGFMVRKWALNIEKNLEEKQEIRQKRNEAYAKLGGDLNAIFSANFLVGRWLEYSPDCIVEMKRKTDTEFFSNISLWRGETIKAYNEFMHVCFKMQGGAKSCIKLLADKERYIEEFGESWVESDNSYFLSTTERKQWISDNSYKKQGERGSYRKDILLPAYVNLAFEFGVDLGNKTTKSNIMSAFE